jgi:glycosyltransferase involved in cell wall biosynthesis
MLKVAYLSSYAPRECGIATFTEDLIQNINSLHALKPASIIAINEPGSSYCYGKEVAQEIDEEDKETYKQAAHQINNSDFDLINIQHEFGLFGRKWGNNFLTFLEELDKPSVTTMHTTLSLDSKRLQSLGDVPIHKKVVKQIGKKSSAIVVMTRTAANILKEDYKIDSNKIRIIPHGCPDMPFVPSKKGKASLGLENRIVLSTFGLLSRDKGIQSAIRALPHIVKDWPEVLYLVIGQTHPQVRIHEGERYRKRLMKLVKELNLKKHVRFHNRFVNKEELIKFLQATDIYLCPYVKKDQLSSGTITYALGAGKAIVSTPFYYAMEVLAEERGLLCRFKSGRSIAESVRRLLSDSEFKNHTERLAYKYSRDMTWPKVASKYVSLFKEMMQ